MTASLETESTTEATAMFRVCVVSSDITFARALADAVAGDELDTDSATLGGVRSQPAGEIDVAVLDFTGATVSDDDVVALRTHIRGPVIVLTADARETSVIGPLAAGARGVVLRSSDAAVVRAAVRAVGQEQGVFIDPAVGTTLARLVTVTARSHEGTDLTPTELRVLQRFPKGLTNAQIAEDMDVSINTIKTHVRHILAKLDCDDRVQAVRAARTRGLLL